MVTGHYATACGSVGEILKKRLAVLALAAAAPTAFASAVAAACATASAAAAAARDALCAADSFLRLADLEQVHRESARCVSLRARIRSTIDQSRAGGPSPEIPTHLGGARRVRAPLGNALLGHEVAASAHIIAPARIPVRAWRRYSRESMHPIRASASWIYIQWPRLKNPGSLL